MFSGPQSPSEPIAIVGSACRFPGDATTPAKLWELLKAPRDVLTEIPESRFNFRAFYHPDGLHHGTSNVRHSYSLSDDHRHFDAQFFGTKPIEANSIDPQQRLLLETVYEGLESAGIPMERLQGSNTGVYVGSMTNDYADLLGRDIQNFPTYFASGTARSILSNRVSYFFDWHGPSMTIDTACSSSLIAVHQAVLSLRNGESNVAVAAGTNLLLGPEQYVAESKLKMLSPTGRSRMWDKDADGYARGDGIAAVVLKPLSAALADGDHIECLIRETGINQDGRTKGITMPNPIAQADLIRATYARAGLDLSNPSDRPQYFEAHGTGTPAGDPVEAEAISTAFFGAKANYHRRADQEPPLYVGSIKTVIGHTEGTAGLAAVLKASLALQHAVIPPNLLLNELNPAVRPFYNDLQIPQIAREWPGLRSRAPRRASVNSFGFGGANAHAILEAFEPDSARSERSDNVAAVLTPFNFSASSEKSLLANLRAYSAWLKSESDVNLGDLSWTLNCRRSTLPFRLSISASGLADLVAKVDTAAESPSAIIPGTQTSNVSRPTILGIFTGQGAQWPRMGAELLVSSSLAIDCIGRLDAALQALPDAERPSWSLKDEILKDASSSRIGEALLSQTLSTAVQIMLVGLLRAAGVFFTAVVGHSSGEIGAAYAAGYLSADDAIKVAYFRGWSLQNAPDREGVKGAMMAVGTSIDDAKELCDMPTLQGRICVAASNSSVSVTLSGDADAIDEAKEIFEDEKKFVRLLKVDKAYHSHHMLPCAAPYIQAIQKCGVKIQDRSGARTKWISSVYSKDIDEVDDSLTDTYWSNNMVNPVRFAEAVSFAVGVAGPFDMALEVGPHPALKGPALQTIQEVSGSILPYSGTLSRYKNDRESFASALGALWVSLGENAVDFAKFQRKAAANSERPRLLKGLPSYSWDHDRVYWHESRISTTFRAGTEQFHPLLGIKCPNGTEKELRWRNYLNPREIPWLAHHRVQGQMVFPAAGYISAATEMVVKHYGLPAVELVDFHDVIIGQALVLEDNVSVEVIFTLTIIETSRTAVQTVFNCYSDANKGSSSLSLHASAQLQILLGEAKHDALPSRTGSYDRFLQLDAERFYNSVSELGFGYTGPFQALSGLSRKMDEATGFIAVPIDVNQESALIVHPASLDGAIQSIMLAYCFPGDGRLRTLYLPTRIDRIRINPFSCVALAGPGSQLPFHSSVADARFAELSGDVDIYSADRNSTVIQLQGLHTTPLTPLTAATDVLMFTEIIWGPEEPTRPDLEADSPCTPADCTLASDLERVAYFYLKRLHLLESELGDAEIAWHHKHLLSYASHCSALVHSAKHPFAKPEWANDTKAHISGILEKHKDNADVKIMSAVGEILPAVVRGETNLLDTLMKDNLLNRFYSETFGIQAYLREITRVAGQISNRHPHINVLEIGAGTGEATEPVLRAMDTAFASYTFTDFIDSRFDEVQAKFGEYRARMAFKMLDIEKDPVEQGYGEESYDLILASLALHATKSLATTLVNVRRLLKPGGYLILLEFTDPNAMRVSLILGGLPGWWLGNQEGRILSPCVSVQTWGDLMSKAGFSGVDTFKPHHPEMPVPFSVVVTQAVDDRIEFLRSPLTSNYGALGVENLTIIGGKTRLTTTMVSEVLSAVRSHYDTIKIAGSLEEIAVEELPMMGTVLSFAELDGPAFVSMTAQRLKALQELFRQGKNILWVGHGSHGDNPFAHMFVGVQRTLVTEMNHLRVQFLNLHSLEEAKSDVIARKLLQLEATDVWYQDGRLSDILWTTEPEITLRNGLFYIPRFRLGTQRNDRYNSSKRPITKPVDRNNSVVTVQPSGRGYQVLEAPATNSPFFADQAEVQVTNSILRSVKVTESCSLFVVAGTDLRDNGHVVALSKALDSRIRVPASWIVRCGQSSDQAVRSMLSLYTRFLAQSMIRKIAPGKTLAVLDPDFSMSAVLSQYANERGVQLAMLTTKEGPCSPPWIYVHRYSTRRELLSKLPPNVAGLFDIRGQESIVSMLNAVLPADCQVESEQTLTEENARDPGLPGLDQIFPQLHDTWMRAYNEQTPVNVDRLPKLDLRGLIEIQQPSISQSVVSWESPQLPVQVLPATRVVRFAKDKTYWLVGLTGGLGLSLCQWMAHQGARYIALSSRSPKIDERWIREMAKHDCTVRVFANDITDRDSVHSTYRQILGTMPAVGGVAQGAMVLQDTMFLDLDLARFDKVLRPKVDGSLFLDELFPENTLDFMIFFSSMAAMTGNPGQVAYNAANMFMASLAAQRRQRGLAAQAINLGAIVGNGYVTRELNMGQQSYLYRVGHSHLSEQDFLEVFAEGVLSCPDGTGSPAPCSGLRIDDDESKSWVSNPMFQHLVFKSNTFVSGDKKSKTGVMVKTRLFDSTSQIEVMDILQEKFTVKLQSALQTDPNKSILDLSPDELGVDSLIAVDLRSWFLKELGVDIPVLKIFNAASIRDLLELAAGLLPESLIPNVKGNGKNEVTEPEAQQTNQTASDGSRSAVEIPESTASSDNADEGKVFQLDYLPSYDASGSSAASLNGGDSSPVQSENTSSSSSLDNDIEIVPKRDVLRIAPMSFSQSRFWFLKFFVQNQTAFNVTPQFELTGPLRVEDFARAVEVVGQHHQALSTFFFTDESKRPMQGVWAKTALRLEHIHISDRKEVAIAAERMKSHVFDIADGEILRIQLLSLTFNQHWLIFGFHHINMDGVSFEILWSDLEKAYQGIPLSLGTLQYPDYAEKQLREYEEGARADDLAYWRGQYVHIPDPIPLLRFSLQPMRPSIPSYTSHWIDFRLQRKLVDDVERCSRMFKVTPFHFYLATWQILLLRHFDIDDICVGLGDGGRTDADAMQSIGLYLNLLPIRFYRKASQSFSEALRDTKSAAQNGFAHSRVPFDVLLSELNVPRSASYNPLFQVFFNYRKLDESRNFCGCVAKGSLLGSGETSYDLHLDVADLGSQGMQVHLLAQKDLYGPEHGKILLRSYCNLLEAFAQNPATRVTWPSLFADEDVEQALAVGRGAELKCQWPATVVHRVDEIAQAHPDHPALREEDGTELTYSQLQDRVSVIASELSGQGAGIGTRVGVFQSPSADWICSMLAILRAGGIYVPLDKKVGMERLAILASEFGVKNILVDSTTAPDYQLLRTSAGLIDVSSLKMSMVPSVPNFALSTQPAVIMFTSGSTGTPKGITIGHSAYVHHVHAFSRTLGIQETHEVILHQSSYAWDMSLYQILVSLCNAATLVIASSATRGDPVAISNLIASSKVTASFATPTEYLGWLRYGLSALKQSKWTTAVSGGEFVSNGLIKEFQSLAKPDLKLINVYGPAETTLACASGEVPYSQVDFNRDKSPLCLYTLPNYSVYIVDDDLKPVPLSVPGEVVVGGGAIAQGYLDSDRTKERFDLDRHASPFFESQGWTKIHRTGDRGKLTSDGALILLGRIDGDNQIKLGGIRVNVEEIEAALVQASNGSISHVVVSPRTSEHGDGSSPFLVAFVVLSDADTHGNQSDFLQQLLQDSPLPQYMRPAAIIPIHSIPQNTSGKVDRLAIKNLPIPKLPGHTASDNTLAPFEVTLRQLWQEVIPPDVVSLYPIQSHSDFFHVGGSSLSLVTLQALIKNHLAMAVPLHSLFESSTLQGMAQRIQNLSISDSAEEIDWDGEIESLLDFDEPLLDIDTSRLPSGAGVVVITGATGFIGKEVVRQLVEDAAVEAIYCVAVRKPLARLPTIFASSKVQVYHGNLTAPQLGLSDADATSIFSRADVVIHNGADVSFMKSYHTLKMPNVLSTQELVRLALPRRIPFHFVSSASATRLAAMDSFGETSLAAYPPHSVPDDGYTAAKWVSEVFLERVNERFGLPVWIHRPSSVTGTDAPELDLMSNVIRYCQQTKKIPDSGSWSGVFDFISLPSAANLIIEAVHSAGTSVIDTGGVRYVHESGEIQLGQDEVQSLMEPGTGHQFEVVPVDEWVDHAEKAGMSNLLGIYLRKASAGQVLLPRLIKGSAEAGQV